MLAFAQTKSSSRSLSNPSSPQYKAVEWLAQDKVDNDSNWSGYELLQRYVLRVLYHSTDGETWSNSASPYWFKNSRVCQWSPFVGLFCRGNGQQVDSIDLHLNNLHGSIPEELGLLTALTGLSLNRNQLTGTIPKQLGQLTALILSLWSTHLTGTIPDELGLLTVLTGVSLYDNKLTGTIPPALTQWTSLKKMYIFNNNLTGQVPFGFCAAPFPDWRVDGDVGNQFWADCMSEVQCDCCDVCFDANGNDFCWNGSAFTSNVFEC